MKRKLLTLFSSFSLLFAAFNNATAQVICIFCYDQNDSISTGVNNLILNGGFENNNCIPNTSRFCPNSTAYSCDIANWQCTGGGTLTYARVVNNVFGKIVEGANAAYFGNDYSSACTQFFDTTCLSSSGCEVTGVPPGYPLSGANYGGATGVSLHQSVSGLTVGNTYILEFWTGGEGGSYYLKGLFAVDVGFGNIFLRDPQTLPNTGIGTRFIIEFNATSTTHDIKFTNWGHMCDHCTELYLDDVRLYTLPELSSSVPPCVTAAPVAAFTSANVTLCSGSCTNFTNLSTSATTYQWSFPGGTPSASTDVNPQNICYATSGTYDVTLIASNGTSADTLTLSNYVTVFTLPAAPTLTQSGDTLFASQNFASYQWYRDSVPLPAATNYFYVAPASGNYNLIVTDSNGCEVGAGILNVIAGVNQFNVQSSMLNVFPNPAHDAFTVYGLPPPTSSIEIFNTLGEVVYKATVSSKSETVNCKHFPSGIYLLKIVSEEKSLTQKIIVSH